MDRLYRIFRSDVLLSSSDGRPHGFLSEVEYKAIEKADTKSDVQFSSFLHLTGIWTFSSFIPLGFYLACVHHTVITLAIAIVAFGLCVPSAVITLYIIRLAYVYIKFCYHLSYTQSAWIQMDKLHEKWLKECFRWEHDHPDQATKPGFIYCREKRVIMFRRLAFFILRYHNYLSHSDMNSTIDLEVQQLDSLVNLAAAVPDQFLSLTSLNNMVVLMNTMRSKTILTVNIEHQRKISEMLELNLFSWNALRYCEGVGSELSEKHVLTANAFQLKMEVQLEMESEATLLESSRILDMKPQTLEEARRQYKYLAERLISIDKIHRDDPECAFVYLELLDNSESPRDDVFSAVYSILIEVKRAMDVLERIRDNQRNFNMSG
ncbi:unnamed protein product [Bursaphelenchus xylophilus]|uniref:(pine wood nematode) hypothetical protein n=1 Tax=Bursaphelenchus xylophilus TaxID=6326 RepID=A0A1I7S428_BURXY|nr:unnamed protein product [Bursaphelenchus xylophilus]CAG9116659.1 unnamed protein product [Bursaphelenchus xylophilus]